MIEQDETIQKRAEKCIALVEETCAKLIDIANDTNPAILPHLVLDFIANLIDCVSAACVYAELVNARETARIDPHKLLELANRINVRPVFREQLIKSLKDKFFDQHDVV